MTNWTKGPWTVIGAVDTMYLIGQANHGESLCDVFCHHDPISDKPTPSQEQAANANLIAAAPELYEALEAFARGVDLWLPADCHVKEDHCGEAEALSGLHRKMLGALDKARGES